MGEVYRTRDAQGVEWLVDTTMGTRSKIISVDGQEVMSDPIFFNPTWGQVERHYREDPSVAEVTQQHFETPAVREAIESELEPIPPTGPTYNPPAYGYSGETDRSAESGESVSAVSPWNPGSDWEAVRAALGGIPGGLVGGLSGAQTGYEPAVPQPGTFFEEDPGSQAVHVPWSEITPEPPSTYWGIEGASNPFEAFFGGGANPWSHTDVPVLGDPTETPYTGPEVEVGVTPGDFGFGQWGDMMDMMMQMMPMMLMMAMMGMIGNFGRR